ncbi:Nickel/cobalt transporter regulator [Sphingomonas gellani]|uniref:Nickel/cobalt transporter regulator n=1 Tax=Sphingomonas gellani TaxID=1166340 RepID=A0A1H8H541_9SPHN|nr:RcnB family protein [Sphingomonas gellani]SEN51373.1 Nickel/cobalt transporter regulator [Sphingomonas gellani]
MNRITGSRIITGLLIAAAAVPAVALPTVASAQSREELARDRRDIREERRDLDHAYRYGDRGDIRRERGDLREAHREYREDLRGRYGRDDWRAYRDRDRALYARGNWRAPFRYNSFRPGVRIAPNYYGRGYWISDPYRYHLPQTAGYQRWVRHYDDVLLVDTRRGYVVDVIRGFYR